MKTIVKNTIIALAISTATSSFAQEFTGLYIGESVNKTEMTDNSNSLPVGIDDNGKRIGMGLHIGYNNQLSNNLVIGAKVAYSGAKVGHDFVAPNTEATTTN